MPKILEMSATAVVNAVGELGDKKRPTPKDEPKEKDE